MSFEVTTPYGVAYQGTSSENVGPWNSKYHAVYQLSFSGLSVPGVYQVRGLDIANMTLIEGDSGVIVVDTLTSIEGARAAMELYFQHRGKRPVAAVIFTHTHTDHWGGARGVLDDETLASGKVPVIAPEGFLGHAVSENVYAGGAMIRRATYMYGPLLEKGPAGQVGAENDGLSGGRRRAGQRRSGPGPRALAGAAGCRPDCVTQPLAASRSRGRVSSSPSTPPPLPRNGRYSGAATWRAR